MADNTTLNVGTGGDVIATDDLTTLNGGAVSGFKVQRVKVGFGSDGSLRDVDATNGLPVSIVSGAQTSVSGNIAAAATGTIGPLDITNYGNASVIVKNQTAGTAFAGAPVLVFEQSDDGTSWAPWMVKRDDTGGVNSTWVLSANSANTEVVFDGSLEAVTQVRVRVTTGPTTNPMTVSIRAGAFPFVPHVTVTQKHNAGRQQWVLYAEAVTGVAALTALSAIAVTGVTAAGTATSYTVPAGKTLRITSAVFGMLSNGATLTTAKMRLHAVTSGALTAATGNIVLSFPRVGNPSATTAANEGGAQITISLGEGIEFVAGNTIGLSHQESATGVTIDAMLIGQLY